MTPAGDGLVPIEDPNQAVVGTGVPPIIAPGYTFGSVTDKIAAIVLAQKTPLWWWLGFGVAFMLTLLLLASLAYLVVTGIVWIVLVGVFLASFANVSSALALGTGVAVLLGMHLSGFIAWLVSN